MVSIRPDTLMTEILRQVDSVCPQCLKRLTGSLIRQGDEVLLAKSCPEHGSFSTVVWRGTPAFESWLRPKIPYNGGERQPTGKGCPFDCGLCLEHAQRTCTVLVEVTSRCNLRCPVCFADSGGTAADPDLDALSRMFNEIHAATGGCNLQLSGGEPTVRRDLPEVVRAAKQAGFDFVQLNTNGLLLAEDPALAEQLRDAGLSSVFLQFDGVDDQVFTALRGRQLFEQKCRAIDNLAVAGLGVVLVPTIVRGVNSDQLWDIVRFGLARQPTVRGVHFQPISYFGRYPADFVPDHVTLPELMTGLQQQSKAILTATDFLPPGCEHALCSFSARYLVKEDGELTRIGSGTCDCKPQPAEAGALTAIAVTARQWGPARQDETCCSESRDDLDRFLLRARSHIFAISAMAFQDAWTLNLERLQACCIHVARPGGRLVPFCSYNLTSSDGLPLHRNRI
jgi:7,8-dihydro-6-hydroxymethylpterin dimethyltransferase